MKYITPGGNCPRIYSELTQENHILIAGCTGSGKSTFINSFISRLLMENSPARLELVLIDLKKVELYQYKRLPHCLSYSDTAPAAVNALNAVLIEIDKRFNEMRKQGRKTTARPHIYIVIDEFADLIITAKKQIEPLITRISQIGRAAGVHLIIGTQRPTREIITGCIKVNFDCKIALRTATAQDSRNIIGVNGAENLPRYGAGIIARPGGIACYELPIISPAPLVDYWTSRKCRQW